MRRLSLFLCIAILACAPRGDQPGVSASKPVESATSSTQAAVAQPVVSSTTSSSDTVGNESWRQQPTDPKYLKMVYRLAPDSIPTLPKPVVATLRKRDCMVPQVGRGDVSNAVAGAFTRKGVVEWAVFCSVRDTSQILILNAESGAVVDSAEKTPDLPFIESEDGMFWVVGETVTLESAETLNGKPDSAAFEPVDYAAVFPKPIDHDGIGHWFNDKGGDVLYSAHGKWYQVSIGD
jgi:hypothetical protein